MVFGSLKRLGKEYKLIKLKRIEWILLNFFHIVETSSNTCKIRQEIGHKVYCKTKHVISSTLSY